VGDLGACHTTCYNYICTSPTTCEPPVNVCGCDGVRGSGATYDPNGVCCLASAKDCAGYCSGGHAYDLCGVCTAGGALYSACKKDCGNNYYLALTSAPTGLVYQANLPTGCTVAGYLLLNAAPKTYYINTGKSVASVVQYYHDTGVFLTSTESYCTLDLAAYNAAYGGGFTQASAESNWLASLLTGTPRTAQCAAGSHIHFPPLQVDSCGLCILNEDTPPYCVEDCTNTWRTSASTVWFVDNCGVCVAPGTNVNLGKDYCGVCFGNNATLNQCGVCGGTQAIDKCNQPVCKALNCSIDCDGVSRNPLTHHVDACGECILGTDSSINAANCKQDCAGIWYNTTTPPHHLDNCGNCVLANVTEAATCIKDCNGTWGGNATVDACGQCVVNNNPTYVCKQDCAGVYYLSNTTPVHTTDSCGICNTLANQNNYKDKCGICNNTLGYNSAVACTPDCKGVWSPTTSTGRAFTDACGVCWFANQSSQANSEMDACGVCFGTNSSSGIFDSTGYPCRCGQTPTVCSDNSTTCRDVCPVYCSGTANTTPDKCGLCPGNSMYNKTDLCGACCNPDIGIPCNTEIDSCGVCFGYNAYKNNPCDICDPNNTICVQDCAGNWNAAGTGATIQCDGTCSTTKVTCAVCGNSVVETGETCDKGSQNGKSGSGCSSTCQTVAAQDVGAAIGGAIGGVAAIAALALAAFFAVRYAQKNGLIGSANKQVDFGASNSNPLYKSEVSVHSNPLYAAS